MIFRSMTFFAFFSVFVISFCVIYFQTKIHPEDKIQYQNITKKSLDLRSSKSLERNPTYQVRKNADKDIWRIKGDERVHMQMHSNHSKLSLKQKKDRVFLKEELEQITCLTPIGLLQAASGLYDYPGQNFNITHVECIHSLGNIKAEKAILKSNEKNQLLTLSEGVNLSASKETHPLTIFSEEAICEVTDLKTFPLEKEQKIEFFRHVQIEMVDALSNTQIGILRLENTPPLPLSQIKASGGYAIYNQGSLALHPEVNETYCHLEEQDHKIDAQEIHFDLVKQTIVCIEPKGSLHRAPPLFFSSDQLLWEKKQELITLKENVKINQQNKFTIDADLAKMTLENHAPKLIEITSNVRLFSPSIQNKDTFALADTIFMNLENNTLILIANAPKRVLFWQEGVTLSAPEIQIHKDPVTNEESIQGKGDIHFTFSTEEKNIIDQFISKYL
jgi:hypothetical protein